jgi:hypothetical protein
MTDYTNHDSVKSLLEKDQAAEKDERDLARIDQKFIHEPDGMWQDGDDDTVRNWGKRPKITLDMISPQIDQIAGEIEQNEFEAKIDPMGGGATKETAKVFGSVIRNIQVASNAPRSYQRAGRKMIEIGFDAVRVRADYESAKSFKQVLLIEKVDNAINRIWFDSNSVKEDRSDSNHGWDLRALNKSVYDEQWPKGTGQSLNDGSSATNTTQNNEREVIIVGEVLYKEKVNIELVEFSDGTVLEVDKTFDAKSKILADKGVTKVREPVKRHRFKVMSRWFDGGGWLDTPKDTPFDLIPLCPAYGNFDIVDNSVTFSGVVRKFKDANRVINFSESKQLEEVATSPVSKLMMTETQAAGHEKELETMNKNNNPVQLYSVDEKAPPPYQTAGTQVNSALVNTTASMTSYIQVAGNQHNDPQRKFVSGVAMRQAENKGNTSNIKYHNSLAVMITYVCKVLKGAVPPVYDTQDRIVRGVEEDGAVSTITLNTAIRGEKGLESTNDLSIGEFDVTCSVGQAFKNRQQEAQEALLAVAAIDPAILARNADVFVGTVDAPGMNIVQERERAFLFKQDMIPDEQWTDEEKQEVEEAQALATQQAEAGANQVDPIQQAVVADAQSQIEKRESDAQNDIAQLQLQIEKQQQDFFVKQEELELKRDAQDLKNLETMTKMLGDLTDAWSKGIVGPPTIPTVDNQARLVLESQNLVSDDLPTNSDDITEPSGPLG